ASQERPPLPFLRCLMFTFYSSQFPAAKSCQIILQEKMSDKMQRESSYVGHCRTHFSPNRNPARFPKNRVYCWAAQEAAIQLPARRKMKHQQYLTKKEKSNYEQNVQWCTDFRSLENPAVLL